MIHIRFFPSCLYVPFSATAVGREESLLLVFMTCNNYISLWHNYCHFCQQNAQGKGMPAAAFTANVSLPYIHPIHHEKKPKALKQTVYCLTDEVTRTPTFSVQELCDRNSFADKDGQWYGMKRHHFSTDFHTSHASHIFSTGRKS